jgi:hypothetical protein
MTDDTIRCRRAGAFDRTTVHCESTTPALNCAVVAIAADKRQGVLHSQLFTKQLQQRGGVS